MKTIFKRSLFCIGICLITLAFFGCGGVTFLEKSKRNEVFKNKTISVYPVHVLTANSNFDSIIAKKIVNYINEKENLKAVFVNQIPPVNSKWYMNEAKMFSLSVNSFIPYIKTNDKTGDYCLLVEFLKLPREICVHYYLIDKVEGKAVCAGLCNSDHKEHKMINPKTDDDALKLFELLFDKNIENIKNKK